MYLTPYDLKRICFRDVTYALFSVCMVFLYVYYSLYKFQYRYVDFFLRKNAVTDINFVYVIHMQECSCNISKMKLFLRVFVCILLLPAIGWHVSFLVLLLTCCCQIIDSCQLGGKWYVSV